MAEAVVVIATAAAVVAVATAVAVVVVEVPRQVVVSVPPLLPQLLTKVGGLLVRRTATAAVLVAEATVGSRSVEATSAAAAAPPATVENPTHAYNAPPHSRIVTYLRNMS